jgi:autotransporter strand-loop-strand O-heptosyltransferase
MKVYSHCSYIGETGFNNHSREFFRNLSNHLQLKVRNFTVGKSWVGLNDTPHDNESYITDIDKKILYEQILWTGDGSRENFKIYPDTSKEFVEDFNIILNETNHHIFYDNYSTPKIAYTVWESTLLPQDFFNKLLEFDEVWTPSTWQKECMVNQGLDENLIKVVPEGVDINTFYPEKVDLLDEYKDGRFKFIVFGRWDYRKSTKEIIETFLKTFDKSDPVDLVLSIDNPWGEKIDGFKTTEDRLQNYGLIDDRIKIIHFPSREDYVKFIKTGHVFVSCARSEGWNLPLIESMASGTPSIYSNCSGQLEFAKGMGIPVNIIGEISTNNNSYGRYSMGEIPGNYYEPDFDDLSAKMRFAYEFYDEVKKNAILDSKIIREKFNWEIIGQIGLDHCTNFYKKIKSNDFVKNKIKNEIFISYVNGPKVEVKGSKKEKYHVEFIDSRNNKIIFSTDIENNMWASCGIKYFIPWIIKINGVVFDTLNLNGKNVLISFESKSVGDTIAWAPYAIDFSKKHNCNVILSTFHNDWFEGNPNYYGIKFISPGSSVECYSVYRIGWFRDKNNGWKNFDLYPNQLNTQPLQKTATDILGLEFSEKNYGINFTPSDRPIPQKYIVISPHSTAGCKEWPYDNWYELSGQLSKKGYSVISLSNKPFDHPNIISIVETDWTKVFNLLYHADLFIGLSSGLSWINWSLGKKTVMISGFSNNNHEFTSNIIRISNNICIKCWTDPVMKFDSGDWNWCPVYKGTELQHICQKSISPNQVMMSLDI